MCTSFKIEIFIKLTISHYHILEIFIVNKNDLWNILYFIFNFKILNERKYIGIARADFMEERNIDSKISNIHTI